MSLPKKYAGDTIDRKFDRGVKLKRTWRGELGQHKRGMGYYWFVS